MPQSSSSNPTRTQPATPDASLKSFVRKILLASPAFPRLYADVVLTYAPNSNAAKILAPHHKKIIERTNAIIARANFHKTKNTRRETMSKSCTHIKVTGVRCGSPALRGEQFCYFHQRMLRTVQGPPASRIHHAALLEDEESIQASLIEVVNALLRGTIEIKRAELVLRALNTAVRNIRRVNLSLHSDMIREIPTYPPAPATEVDEIAREAARAEAARQATRTEIARVRAAHLAPANDATVQPTTPQVGTPHPATTAHVGTAAPGCPSGPKVSGRSALASKPTPTKPPEVTMRKPPVSDRSAQILQSRKQRAPLG